ncbi:MAG TPA: peptidylprolyl isomerase [Bryobacteraceae bacterium]|nr:peptidylprolyl isomerase [Bryobacteraceae bacterium]
MHVRSLGLLIVSLATASAADVRVVEEIVAKVNGDIITRTELEHTRQSIEAELRQQGLSGQKLREAADQRAKDALRDQIDQLLLVQKGKDLNINVDPDVTRRIAEIQLQSKIVDPDKFHEWLHEQTGMSFEDFKSQMKNQLLTQRVVGQEIGSRINIPDAEKRKYYEDHKKDFIRQEEVFLRQILISTEGKTPEQVAAAEKKAKDLVARARKGEKFADLARDNSDDPETARNGGELPPYGRGQLIKQIEDVVFKANRGYVTDPIKVRNGFLVLKVEERYEAGQASYEEVENQIDEQLRMPLMQPKVRTYLTKLREDAFLEIRGGYVDSGAAPGKDTAWKDPAQLKPETVTKEEVASRRKRKLLWVIPAGHKKVKPEEAPSAAAQPPATAAPASAASAPTPAK